MLFSSNIFIFAFLPAVLLAYFLLPTRFRNYFLLAASLFFYAWGEPKFVLAMLASILLNFAFALLVDRTREHRRIAKGIVAISVAANLGLMFVFKYLNFAISNLNQLFDGFLPQTHVVLPIGISFFTFQALSYVVDVYRGDAPVQKNPFYVGLYIAFFPQLIAGPIVRYETIAGQIERRTITFDDFSQGTKRFVVGMCKKVLLANTFAVVADASFAITAPAGHSVAFAWLGALAYSFQILFDFSGYSDMAIGLGRMFGFHFLENFDYPYLAKSVSEFWRRWHISLSTWFRDYVYFPMGGSRVERKSRLVFNLFVVWLLTGVWHGASWNFAAWGLFYFVLLTFEKLTRIPGNLKSRPGRVLYQAFTLLCVQIGWVLFRATNLPNAVRYGLDMFGLRGNAWIDGQAILYFRENWVFLVFATLCAAPFFRRLKQATARFPAIFRLVAAFSVAMYLGLFLLSISYLVVGAYNPFIYFNF